MTLPVPVKTVTTTALCVIFFTDGGVFYVETRDILEALKQAESTYPGRSIAHYSRIPK